MSQPSWVPVRNIMRKDVTFIPGRTSVLEAMRVMKRVEATVLMVEKRDEQDEFGMVSFSDIAKQVIGKDRAPERVNVYEIMAKPVIAVRPDMNTRYCARLFDNFGISHAPVIENEEVLGIVSYYLIALHGLPNLD
jgi:predicted transcriptional regulator